MDDDTTTPDPLQPQDDYFNPALDELKLSEDNDPPFTPADDTAEIPNAADYPASDDGIEDGEAYDEGISHAAGINEQEIPSDQRVSRIELEHQDLED